MQVATLPLSRVGEGLRVLAENLAVSGQKRGGYTFDRFPLSAAPKTGADAERGPAQA